MTTNQTERVPDEELDQMIWKLERDGMTPKQLSLMRELREVRRARGEPVARDLQEHRKAVATPIYQLFDMGWYDTNKQTHDNAVSAGCAGRIVYAAPPAPAVGVIDETLIEGLRFVQCMLDDYRDSNYGHAMDWMRHINTKMEEYSDKHGDDAYRVMRETMQLSGNSEQLEPVSNRDELPPNSFTNEELAGMAHGDNPQANAYRDLLAFQCNSPATPDGWKLVPEEPTHEMLEAGDAQFGTYDVYRRMIEAVSKEVG